MTNSFRNERSLFDEELEAHYSTYPTDLSQLEAELHDLSARHPGWPPFERKAAGYALMAERCAVKLFRHCPFYFEMDVGKPRTDLGSGGIGSWLKREPFGQELAAQGAAWWQPYWESGLSAGWAVLDDNHHQLGLDNVFRYGLNGLIARAEARLAQPCTDDERAFLKASLAGNRAVITIANRLADEAERMLAAETEPHVRTRLERIAVTARRVPAEPPQTFYEALNTILFMKEIVQSLEGNGISIWAHLDRLLWPFYEADLAAGRLTQDEAKDLLACFLAFSDRRFGMRQMRDHVGTNSTIGLGGCDAAGNVIFNDLTRLVIEILREFRFVDPKINARVSSQHPWEYLELLSELQLSGANNLALFSDDVIIEANVRMGKRREDCRLYVGGGCQENVLENTEINSRASIYLNLAHVLQMGFAPERWAWLAERDGVTLKTYSECADFEQLYAAFLDNLHAVTQAHVDQRNRTEREGVRYNPCPLHSATVDDCLDRARDMMDGGARYSFGSVSLTGMGTLVDSLYAIRQLVFVERRVSLAELADILDADFAGEEALRQYVLHRLPKFGQDDAEISQFAARVFSDAARVTSGMPNSRGGVYEASLFSFRSFAHMGLKTGATPDGRRAGEHLSPGMSPSQLAVGERAGVGPLLQALAAVEMRDYPVVAVLDVKLPLAAGGYEPPTLVPVILRFIECGGSVLQINCLDPAVLIEAQAHPERHPDLVVRVSGYSAYFNTLCAAMQNEIIARATVEAT